MFIKRVADLLKSWYNFYMYAQLIDDLQNMKLLSEHTYKIKLL